MAHYKLWGVYTPLLEQWTRETGARMEALVDNPEHELEVEYFSDSDPRVSLYGWQHFPIFVALKHDQPFRKIIGKLAWEDYEAWLKELSWTLDV
jgi:hypothetical protein